MDAQTLRDTQAPLKAKYRDNPASALVTLEAESGLDADGIACSIAVGGALAKAGLHPATGGSGAELCSGNMLLEALAACAGVTLRAVATAKAIDLKAGRVSVEGDLDFRGTLGLDKTVPVGFKAIRLGFSFETDASPDQIADLVALTERYCVVLQTLKAGAAITTTVSAKK
jgi:uncharacterized OsmC-like protein